MSRPLYGGDGYDTLTAFTEAANLASTNNGSRAETQNDTAKRMN
jgi:hypothetical protein